VRFRNVNSISSIIVFLFGSICKDVHIIEDKNPFLSRECECCLILLYYLRSKLITFGSFSCHNGVSDATARSSPLIMYVYDVQN